MNKQIRQSVFETNSSSSHSLTLGQGQLVTSPFSAEELRSGFVEIPLGEFGWEWMQYHTTKGKLSYLASQIFNNQGYIDSAKNEEVLDSEPLFEMLSKVVRDHTGCELRVYGRAEVDHQSAFGDGANGRELFESEEKLKAFIFDPTASILTGNDNDSKPWTIRTEDGESVETYASRFKDVPKGYKKRLLKTLSNKKGGRAFVNPYGGVIPKGSPLMTELQEHAILKSAIVYSCPMSYGRVTDLRAEALEMLDLIGLGEIKVTASVQATQQSVQDYSEEGLEATFMVPDELAEKLDSLDRKGVLQFELDYLVKCLEWHEERVKAEGANVEMLNKSIAQCTSRIEALRKALKL